MYFFNVIIQSLIKPRYFIILTLNISTMYDPQRYSRNIDFSVKTIKELLDKNKKFLKWSSEPESILDLGIGDGRITKEVFLPVLPKNIKEFVGGDISETMLKSAEKTLNYEKYRSFLIDAQAKSVPVEMKNRFHDIFANYLLHHTRNIRQALSNIKVMLKPGGQFMFYAFEEIYTDEAFEKLDQGKWKKYNNEKAISPFYRSENRLKEYEILTNSVGFVDCHIFTQNFQFQRSLESFEELMSAVNTRLPFVEEDDREAYMKDYIEETKKTKIVKIITDEETNEQIVHVSLDIVNGVVSKPL